MKGDLAGKVMIVTGATSGVGKETARALVKRGAVVGLVGRDAAKGAATIAEFGKVAGKLHFFRADLASLSEVRVVARQIGEQFKRIDVLVNNAGVVNTKRKVTADGFEETFAVNHLAHFLLTGILLPKLLAATQGRVVNVSSDAHLSGRFDVNDLQSKRHYRSFRVYGTTKLENLLFTFELARRLEGTTVTANVVHPGAVATNFARNNGWLGNLAMSLAKPFFISAERGAETSVYLASDPSLATITGRYFEKKRQQATSPRARDLADADALWRASEELTGLSYDEVLPPGQPSVT